MKTRIPKYRLHKATGQAVVTLNGHDIYLGKHDSAASRQEYDRLIGEWQANGRQLPGQGSDVTINELLVAYLEHAELNYRHADGTPTSEYGNIKRALRPLRQAYGHTRACEFGPLALKAVRETMVAAGYRRSPINKNISRIKQLYKWAVSNEMIPAGVYQALSTVAGLKKFRSAARESDPVRPVAEKDIAAVLPLVTRQVAAMVELQRLTGMRPGEVVSMRTCDIERGGDVWQYRPTQHKTQHHGHERIIALGPKAQTVLQDWLRADPETCLFSPHDAAEQHYASRREERRTKIQPSQQNRRVTNRKRPPAAVYTPDSYRRAIQRACERAEIPKWNPHQLRHTAATRIRRDFGLEAAQLVLGHKSADITQVYAERDQTLAARVMQKVG